MRLLYQLTLQSSTQQSLVATLTLLRTTSHRVLLTLDEEETPYPSAIGLAHDPNRQSDVIAKEKNLSVNVRTRRPNNHVLAQPATTMLQTTLIAWFLRGGILRIIQNTPMHRTFIHRRHLGKSIKRGFLLEQNTYPQSNQLGYLPSLYRTPPMHMCRQQIFRGRRQHHP